MLTPEGFELAKQIASWLVPEPTYIKVSVGQLIGVGLMVFTGWYEWHLWRKYR